jgi:hypothetical protein
VELASIELFTMDELRNLIEVEEIFDRIRELNPHRRKRWWVPIGPQLPRPMWAAYMKANGIKRRKRKRSGDHHDAEKRRERYLKYGY